MLVEMILFLPISTTPKLKQKTCELFSPKKQLIMKIFLFFFILFLVAIFILPNNMNIIVSEVSPEGENGFRIF